MSPAVGLSTMLTLFPRLLREQWIRAKYERQEFTHPDKQEPYSAGKAQPPGPLALCPCFSVPPSLALSLWAPPAHSWHWRQISDLEDGSLVSAGVRCSGPAPGQP